MDQRGHGAQQGYVQTPASRVQAATGPGRLCEAIGHAQASTPSALASHHGMDDAYRSAKRQTALCTK